MKPVNKWVKFDLSAIPSETPVQIRAGKDKEALSATVVLSQHGQLLEGENRRLVEWVPEEMNFAMAEESAA